jgi:membrane fusion protein, multidrug efflux system
MATATRMIESSSLSRALAALLFTVLAAGCGQEGNSNAQPPGGAGAAPPPPEVGVITVTPREVGLFDELPGRLEASRVAQVRARAAGIVQQRLFREGTDVRAGQPLFRIDPAPY